MLHFGVFVEVPRRLMGVLSFGPSINKKGTINAVSGTGWNEFIELNRMAFHNNLPKNSESRCIAICLRLIKKHAPHVKWVISFADATQCGTGTIYRASGFKLVGIAENTALRVSPTGEQMHVIQAHHTKRTKEFKHWKPLKGYQLKYIYFLDKKSEANLQLPIIPFSEIDKLDLPEGVRHHKRG